MNDLLPGVFSTVNALRREHVVVGKLADDRSGDCADNGGAAVVEVFACRMDL